MAGIELLDKYYWLITSNLLMFSINLIYPNKFKSKSNQTVKTMKIPEWIYYLKFDILSKEKEIRRITMYSLMLKF